MTPHERNLARKEQKKEKKDIERKKFSEFISVGNVCTLNHTVVKSIYIAMDDGGYDKINQSGDQTKKSKEEKYRNLLIFFNIEVPKGQQLKTRCYLLVEKQKGKTIELQYLKYKILKEEGASIDKFSLEAQEEVIIDIENTYMKRFNRMITFKVRKSLTLFDTTLFNEAFEFYVENIIRVKNAKKRKSPDSTTMIDLSNKWDHKILKTINMNEYKHIHLNKLFGICYDAYMDIICVIPIIFLIKKEYGG